MSQNVLDEAWAENMTRRRMQLREKPNLIVTVVYEPKPDESARLAKVASLLVEKFHEFQKGKKESKNNSPETPM